MTIITWFSIKLSMNGREKNETTWVAKGLICFKPTRLSHRPLCRWWSVWPLTSGTRRSCGPRESGSALRENIKGVHTIWASDWQSINHSSPATVQLQCAGFFFSSFCVPVCQSCTKTHTPHAVGHTKADVLDFIGLRRWVWAPLSILPPPLPPPMISISFIKHMRPCFFFFLQVRLAECYWAAHILRGRMMRVGTAGPLRGRCRGGVGRAQGVKTKQPCPDEEVDALFLSSAR